VHNCWSSQSRLDVSILADIAEGFGKHSSAEKARFLNIVEGSVEECRYYLILFQDLGYAPSGSLMSDTHFHSLWFPRFNEARLS